MQSECPFCRAQNQAEALHCVECQRALRPGPQSIPQVMRNPPMPPVVVPPTFNPPPPVGNPPFIRPLPPINPPPIGDTPFPKPVLPPIIALDVDVTEKGQPTQTHHFDKTEVILGRVSPASDIAMRKGNVSKRHCRVFVQNNEVFIEDLKTTNGTQVNGKNITSPHQISAGNQIYVSDFTIQVRSIRSALAVPPPLPDNNIAPLPPNPPFQNTNIPPLIRTNPPVVPVAVQYDFEVLVRHPDKSEQVYRVTKEELAIGRGVNANDVVIPSSVLSRRHMKVFVKDKRLFVEDLNSTNGVTINGRKIAGPQEFTVLDALMINEFAIWVRASGPGLQVQPPLPIGVAKAELSSNGIVAGEAFYFLADDFFQAPMLRWLIPSIGGENIPRVIPFTRGDLTPPGAPPKKKPSAPKRLALADRAVLPGQFLREIGPLDPVQLKPLATGVVQLQIVQPMSSLVVQVIDREAPTPRPNAIDPRTAEDPVRSDRLYQVANKFFEQGKILEARAVFEEARSSQANPHPFYAYNVACCEAKLGDTARALEWLRVAVSDGWLDMKHMSDDNDLASLRGLTAFTKLFERGMREHHFARLHPGDTLQIEIFSATLLLVGAFVGGHPWESSVSL